ncbi:MAG: DUF4412 domain-containing protein [Flavobacteriia bacterium]|nr:DUF4412 domain-containing protein [Flavobacteriia bacterium]
MKKIIPTLSILLISLTSFSQITEGHISYKIDFSSDKPEIQKQIGMLQGSTIELYFKDQNTRSEMTMGVMMKITTISNNITSEMLMLMSGMMGNKASKTSLKDNTTQTLTDPKEEINVKLENATKDILGYKCKKAILTDKDGNELIFWYTEDIAINKKGQKNFSSKIPGVPLEYEMFQQGMKMLITATKIEPKLVKKPSDFFDIIIPEGYSILTEEEKLKIGMSN